MSDIAYRVAFSRIPTIGRVRVERLEAYFSSMEEAWRAPLAQLRAAGLEEKPARAVVEARPATDPDTELDRLERLGITPLTWHDARYPARLRETFDRPPLLYLRGTLLPADDWCVAVVGTRDISTYGRQATEQIVEGLVQAGVTVVSGMARGVDTVAHQAALAVGGRTIAVLPCAVDQAYPVQNRGLAERLGTGEAGALLSDYPLGARLAKENFWRRNRLVAGMTLGTVVVEADLKSGSLITARLALEENREVFAVPGSIYSPRSRGTNALIREAGAKLVTRVDDILTELQLMRAPQQLELREALPEDETEAAMLRALGPEPGHIDDLARGSGLPVSMVSAALAMLELKGLARQVAAMTYIRAR